ncbi:MAG: DUF1553 domain-containing protein [Pirellulaceae bacterium]
MTIFDAPSQQMFCVGRNRSDTPLQALALQNDVQHVGAARAFAERLIQHSDCEDEKLYYAFRSATGNPTPEEHDLLAATLANHRKHFEADLVKRHAKSSATGSRNLPSILRWRNSPGQ